MPDTFPLAEPVAIVNAVSGRVLDADTGTIGADGTIVQLYGRSATGLPNRQWQIINTGGSNFAIVNVESHRYLDADTGTIGSDGTKIQLFGTGLPAPANRQWQLTDVGASQFAIINAQSGRVLDADLGTLNADGTKVQLYGTNSLRMPSRQWRIMRPQELDAANLIPQCFQDAPVRFDLLIITAYEFAGLFDNFRAAKGRRGVSSHLVSLRATADGRGGVLDDFPGCDHPERIKTAIELAYRGYGARYVMLVGDASLFPARRVFCVETPRSNPDHGGLAGFQDGSYRPSDLYYASLYHHGAQGVVLASDASDTATANALANAALASHFDRWDYNGNNKYNEKDWVAGALSFNPDFVDGYPDLAVARVPARTTADVQAFLAKVVSYEQSAQSEAGAKSFAFMADALYPTAQQLSDDVKAALPAGVASTTPLTVINSGQSGSDPVAPGWTAGGAANLAGLAGGSWWISYIGHGSSAGWDKIADSGSVGALANGPNYPIVFSASCETGQFASIPPTGPYQDLAGNYLWYWMNTTNPPDDTDPADVSKQIWTEDSSGKVLGYLKPPLTVPTPNPYDLGDSTTAHRTVACAWLFNASGGGIAYFGEVLVTEDDTGKDLESDMVGTLGQLDTGLTSLGDVWLQAQRKYWQANCQNNTDTFRPPRVYLGIMTFFGDPSLQLRS
jgi:Peptidase family C25/Ricin-type beta-trefoil lectin domain-like